MGTPVDPDIGEYYFHYGIDQIGTWGIVDTGTLTIHYEQHPTLPAVAVASDAALPVPVDWETALEEWALWKVMSRVARGDPAMFRESRDHREEYRKEKKAICRSRDSDEPRFPKILDY